MFDETEKIGKGSIIQHGTLNDRIYLIKLKSDDCPEIINLLTKLAKEKSYSKIFCKVPVWAAPLFTAGGFIMEAYIPRFYNNNEAVFFLSKFMSPERHMNIETDKLKELSIMLESLDEQKEAVITLDSEFHIQRLNESHINQITALYKEVFVTYPFPIHSPEYIRQTMLDNVQYFGIEKDGELIALSSAEIDKEGRNAEMTDFATLPAFRGNKLALSLLAEMENEMNRQGISTLYTIARLNSLAMNKTFLKLNYIYSGTLIKNTNIAGKIESMNVLYKHI